MRVRHRLRRASIEFVVVVVGVMVALAGDSWRESRQDARIADGYLHRLRLEVESGMTEQDRQRERLERAAAANQRLVQLLENGSESLSADSVVNEFLSAARIGFGSGRLFGEDVTYRELIASGQLRLIGSATLRESIVGYYAALDRMRTSAQVLPPLPLRVSRATGQTPGDFFNGTASFSLEDRRRLLELVGDPNTLPDLRQAESQLRLLLRFGDLLDEAGVSLLSLLDMSG